MFQYLVLLKTEKQKDFFTKIYKEHRNAMFFTSYNIVHDSSDAEDIVHESFLTLIKHVDKLIDNEPHKIWHYIDTTVKNKSFNLLKRRKIQEDPGLDEEWMQGEVIEKGPDDLIEEFELQEAMTGLLKKLKRPYQQVLALQYYHELSVQEIAEEMETTPDNVRHISMRAKKKLQSILEENGLWNDKNDKDDKDKQ